MNQEFEDGKANKPSNESKAKDCYEYDPDYDRGYNIGCAYDNTQSTCDLKMQSVGSYCPSHPDIADCVEYLHNATKKGPAERGICVGQGDPRPWVVCPQEASLKKYCLNANDTAFCKTIGDLCDEDGFVKPEYPYCTAQVK